MFQQRGRSYRKARKTAGPVPDISRRRFIAGSAATLAMAFFGTNLSLEYIITENTSFEVITPDNDENRFAALRFPSSAWYLLGGYQVPNRAVRAKLKGLQPAMNERAPASYVGYSNEGIDIDKLFVAIYNDANKRRIGDIYLYGDSFGGMVATVLAPMLEDAGYRVRMIVMGSSPSSSFDVLDANKQLIDVAGYLGPYVGVLGRMAVGAMDGVQNPNGRGMYEAVTQGIERSLDGSNNSVLLRTSQGKFLEAFPRQYHGNISPATGIGLLYDEQDPIVDAASAKRGWHRLLPKNPFYEYDLQGVGHASPEYHSPEYQTGLTIIQDQLDPPPNKQPKPRYF
ncbi:hypothetical protein KIH31_16030 [Paenarthrobacter sp. DKR-5]|uniref:hypothetical protein n=1 Tax=Paenarthrobacter sp. DKR-5 TaxID=2835535 RepID=UPI001BDDBFCB|nr:hypothetical protein [Paenarthrobacter sp. DKR-5]MBT1004096.1 hypothetical protein [Paenarthrobacter sp. DKR-5]